MHRVFQHDLYQLRLNTARAYVSALDTSANPVSSDPEEPIKLTAQVLGIVLVIVIVIGPGARAGTHLPSDHRADQHFGKQSKQGPLHYILLR